MRSEVTVPKLGALPMAIVAGGHAIVGSLAAIG
jgi:hypothetical protein